MIPSRAGVWKTSTFKYHLLWEAHQPGITTRTVPSGKSISMPPPARDTTRPPEPRSSPVGASVRQFAVHAELETGWDPGTPLKFGWKVTGDGPRERPRPC